jgi:hypothetical protein
VSSGADLFVVCKQCGSEVSPYITECPYCGNRLRRRAPKLPKAHAPAADGPRGQGLGGLLGRRGSASAGRTRRGVSRSAAARWAVGRPAATIALVATACGVWVATRAEPLLYQHMLIVGQPHGDWWKIFTAQFAYVEGGGGGVYAFVAILATGLFGWLVESRHGPAVVLALYLGAGAAGALVAIAVYAEPIVVGANAGALALLAAWAAPDLRALRAEAYYEGDLLGAGAFAALLLAVPFARPEASWLAGVVGGLIGLLAGLGLGRAAHADA